MKIIMDKDRSARTGMLDLQMAKRPKASYC
jgi:hypothetical protein